MPAVRRILVAIKDPQAKSLSSVAKAGQLARALGAQIELFHALNVPLYVDTSGRDSPRDQKKVQKTQCLKQLEQLAAQLRQRGVEATVAAEWDFPAHEAIVTDGLSCLPPSIPATPMPSPRSWTTRSWT